MKIIYISHATIPSRSANSIHVMKMCQAFARNGHETILIAANKKKTSDTAHSDVYSLYGVDKCFPIKKLPWLKIKSLRRNLFALFGVLQAKKMKPDLVYTRCIFCCFWALTFGITVIFETHTPMEKKKKIQKKLFRKAIQSERLKEVVVITHTLKAHFEEKYPILKGLIHVAPDGADPVANDILPISLSNHGNRLQVGYVGHLYKGKGFEVVTQLASMTQSNNFHVVGGKEDLVNFYKKKYTNLKNLNFHGYVPHVEVSKYLIAFDIVLLPNQNIMYTKKIERDIGQWTSPLKLFEYMSAGKPIIASNLPVLQEILVHNRNALLCRSDDLEAWKDALTKLNNSTLRNTLGANAKNDFIKYYSWQARAQKILNSVTYYFPKKTMKLERHSSRDSL